VIEAPRLSKVPGDLYVNLCKLGPPGFVYIFGGGPRDESASCFTPSSGFTPLF